MEFQAVILAGSSGSALYPLTEHTPKCLLPIANRPLIHYQLEMIENSGFDACSLVTRASYGARIQKAIEEIWNVTVISIEKWEKEYSHTLGERSDSGNKSSTSQSHATSISTNPSQPHPHHHTGTSQPQTQPQSSSRSMHVYLYTTENWNGTADALRSMTPFIHSDFFCLSADFISTIQLHHLADIHRSRNASVVSLLVNTADVERVNAANAALGSSKQKTATLTKPKEKETAEKVLDITYYGMVSESSNAIANLNSSSFSRILYCQSSTDVADNDNTLFLSKNLLHRKSSITFYTTMKDIHCYLFSHWVLSVLQAKPMISSIQAEFIPYLIHSQFSAHFYHTHISPLDPTVNHSISTAITHPSNGSSTPVPKNESQIISTSLAALGLESTLKSAISISHSPPQYLPNEFFRCYTYLSPPTAYCERIYSTKDYKKVNHDLSADPVYNHTPWSPLSPDNFSNAVSKIYPKLSISTSFVPSPQQITLPADAPVLIKRSIIGKGCTVGVGAKIQGCIIMENVRIEDGVNLMECTIGSNVSIGKNSVLKECIIGNDMVLNAGTEAKNEVLSNEQEEM